MCMAGPVEARRRHWIIGVTDGCELPSGFWESNLDSMEEKLVLLITEVLNPFPKSETLRPCEVTFPCVSADIHGFFVCW